MTFSTNPFKVSDLAVREAFRKLVADLFARERHPKHIPDQEGMSNFMASVCVDGLDPRDAAALILTRAARERDDWLVHLGVQVGHRYGVAAAGQESYVPLSGAAWHTSHEDLLQLIKETAPAAIVLGSAVAAAHAELPYLRDVGRGFAVKRWAAYLLRGLRSEESRDVLHQWLQSDDPELRQFAAEVLEPIDDE